MNPAPNFTSPGQPPLVSIVVPTFNRERYLERCVRSILDQTYRNLECIVVDGASKDDSVRILARMAAADPRLKFISEPDSGEVYAVNKGLDMVRGELIAFQASDDYYAPDAVETSVRFLQQNPQFVGVCGDARHVDDEGRDLGRGMITYRGRMAKDTLRRVLILRYKMSPLNHGAFFGWRERILRHGKLNPDFSVTPDVDFYTRLMAGGEEIGCLPRIQVYYTLHADMGAAKYWAKVNTQLRQIHARYGLKWHHHLLRVTVGRAASYFSNPYRTPLIEGVQRELKQWWDRRSPR